MDAIVEAIKDCMEKRIDIGASTPEPSLWDMVRHYYLSNGIEPVDARHYGDAVQDVFAKAVAARLKVSA